MWSICTFQRVLSSKHGVDVSFQIGRPSRRGVDRNNPKVGEYSVISESPLAQGRGSKRALCRDGETGCLSAAVAADISH